MAELNVTELVKQMLGASKKVLDKHWKEVKPYAEQEFRTLAQNFKLIAKLKLEDKITEEKAKLHVDIQRRSARTVLLTIEGLGIIAVESAINAALDIIKAPVNKALGWTIL